MTNKPYTMRNYHENQKKHALEMMRVLMQLIRDGKVKVVSHDFWSYGEDGDTAFRLDIKGNS